MAANNFGQDVQFLQQHAQTIVLGQADGPQICLVPAYQGRTMTSTATGASGTSYGWINYEQVASDRIDPQINLYGGEDRIWIAPEGGQYSIFFDPGAPMDFQHWRTPPLVDSQPFDVVGQDQRSVSFRRQAILTNYHRFSYEMQLDRTVVMLSDDEISGHLRYEIDDSLQVVGHESHNRLTNIGNSSWVPENGLPAIWILGMYKPSAEATIVVPFQPGSESQLGRIVNPDYFGKLDERRLKVDRARSLIFFLGDGRLRSKLGLSWARAKSVMGSWDQRLGVLTITQFNLPDAVEFGYTNNLWEIQDDPYAGDVVNAYNDGPNDSGETLGGFYELESLSPALALETGQSYTHRHRTVHAAGSPEQLDQLAQQIIGVSLAEINGQFDRPSSDG